jgi:hypothetical protein
VHHGCLGHPVIKGVPWAVVPSNSPRTNPDSTDESQDEVDSVSPALPRMRGRPPKPLPIPTTSSWLCPSSRGQPPRAPTALLIRGRLARLQDSSDQDDTPLGNKTGRPKSRTPVELIPEKVEELSQFIHET